MAREPLICRICLESGGVYPCLCRGSLAVHPECLRRWIKISDRKTCEICGYPVVSFWYDLTHVRSDIPLDTWRLLVWMSMFFCVLPFGPRLCFFVFQGIFSLQYEEPAGVFLICQMFTLHKYFILTAAALRFASTSLRWCSTCALF